MSGGAREWSRARSKPLFVNDSGASKECSDADIPLYMLDAKVAKNLRSKMVAKYLSVCGRADVSCARLGGTRE